MSLQDEMEQLKNKFYLERAKIYHSYDVTPPAPGDPIDPPPDLTHEQRTALMLIINSLMVPGAELSDKQRAEAFATLEPFILPNSKAGFFEIALRGNKGAGMKIRF